MVLRFDPSGVGNRCFLAALRNFLISLKIVLIVALVENFMLENQFIYMKNEFSEHGQSRSIENTLFSYINKF